jgi:hypothetical protein
MFVTGVLTLGITANGAEPNWTQVMWQGGTTGESSAEYFEFNASLGTYPAYQGTTNLAYHNPLRLPLNGSVIEQFGQNFTGSCSNYGPASQLFRSYWGPWDYPAGSYRGLQALVTFNYDPSDILSWANYMNDPTKPPELEKSIFLHHNQCYGGSREFGVSLNGFTGQIDFYVLTNANLPGGYVAHDVTGTGYTGSQNFFSIWPEDDGGGTCHFETRIHSASPFAFLRAGVISWSDLQSAGIPGFEPGFCASVLHENGYVTALTKVGPDVTFASGAHSSFNFNIEAIKLGR